MSRFGHVMRQLGAWTTMTGMVIHSPKSLAYRNKMSKARTRRRKLAKASRQRNR